MDSRLEDRVKLLAKGFACWISRPGQIGTCYLRMNARSKCTCLHGVAHDVREIDGECIDQTT